MFVFKLAWAWLSGGGAAGLVGVVTSYLGKLSDNQTTRTVTEVGAVRDVTVSQLQTSAAAYHDRVDLLKSMRVTQWLIAAALLPPLLHQGMIYLDSSPFPVLAVGDGWITVAMHHVGSWRVPKAPEPYADREWSMISSLLGIQGAMTAAGGLLGLIRK